MSTARSSSGWSAPLSGAPRFRHQLASVEDGTRLSLEGELDVVAEPLLASLLDRCTTDAELVVVDLRAVEFLSCGALGLLLTASRRTRAAGGRFVVVRGHGIVQRLLDVVGAEPVLEVVDTPPAGFPLPHF